MRALSVRLCVPIKAPERRRVWLRHIYIYNISKITTKCVRQHELLGFAWFSTTMQTYSTEGVLRRPPNLTSASCDLDLWPPDPQSWPFHLLAPWTTCENFQQNRFIRFQNIAFTRLTDGRTDGRTNGPTGKKHYASASLSLHQSKLAET